MIDPKELRLKNLVLIDNKIREIDLIGKESATVKDVEYNGFKDLIEKNGGIISYSHIYPIPITEKLLRKFGFGTLFQETNSILIRENIYPNEEIIFLNLDNKYSDDRWYCYIYRGGKLKISIMTNIIQYVHQLQNLYFALTGEELKLIKQNA